MVFTASLLGARRRSVCVLLVKTNMLACYPFAKALNEIFRFGVIVKRYRVMLFIRVAVTQFWTEDKPIAHLTISFQFKLEIPSALSRHYHPFKTKSVKKFSSPCTFLNNNKAIFYKRTFSNKNSTNYLKFNQSFSFKCNNLNYSHNCQFQ